MSNAASPQRVDQSGLLRKLQTGLIYKNPMPHLHSVHAYFPSVVGLGESELLATYSLGEAFEAVNLRLHRSRSMDGGLTWVAEGAVCTDVDGASISETGRISVAPNGQVVALLHRHDRAEHLDFGLVNPATSGFVPTTFATAHSADGGRHWTTPQLLKLPLDGSSFELCSPITMFSDKHWVFPTSAWPDWNGNLKHGNRLIAIQSFDGGRSFIRHVDVMISDSRPISFWESKIVKLADGRLLAVVWMYDNAAQQDLPNGYVLSHDNGETWGQWRSTELFGQTLTPFVLSDGRMLCVYRRMDRPGLWAQIVELNGDRWTNGATQPLWGHNSTGLTGSNRSMAENFQVLRFGAPSICGSSDGSVFVAFWCYEDCVSVIRWFHFQVD